MDLILIYQDPFIFSVFLLHFSLLDQDPVQEGKMNADPALALLLMHGLTTLSNMFSF